MFWSSSNAGQEIYVAVKPESVEIGHMAGGQLNPSHQCSLDEFLRGKLRGQVERLFGASVAAKVKTAVEAAGGRSRRPPPIPEVLPAAPRRADSKAPPPMPEPAVRPVRARKVQLATLPVNPRLTRWETHADTEQGHRNVGNAGRCRTRVANQTCWLQITRDDCIISKEGALAPLGKLRVPTHPSSALGLRDHFYLVVAGRPLVVSTTGKGSLPSIEPAFGKTLEATNVMRHGEIVFFAYRWLSKGLADGLLQYVPGQGWVASAPKRTP